MQVFVGTSGWSYDAWRGLFYPEDLPKSKWLGYYASRFSTVEIDATFYRIPTEKTCAGWAAQVPDGVRFALKASRNITHRARLRGAGDTVSFFAERIRGLGDRLGPVLYQLPPTLRKDAGRLRDFLETLPDGQAAAFEFRHPSWFDDEVYGLLRSAKAALCIAESDDLRTPWVTTAPFGYLRLRRQDVDDEALHRWADRIRGAAWSECFVYFKHEEGAGGIRLATALTDLLSGVVTIPCDRDGLPPSSSAAPGARPPGQASPSRAV